MHLQESISSPGIHPAVAGIVGSTRRRQQAAGCNCRVGFAVVQKYAIRHITGQCQVYGIIKGEFMPV
jgi:hypothetical protein